MMVMTGGKNSFHTHCKEDTHSRPNMKKRKTLDNYPRNTEGLEIGDYLYK
jgi:hypothetical protein